MIQCKNTFIILCVNILIFNSCASQPKTVTSMKNREAVFVGKFYEENPVKLKQELEQLFKQAKTNQGLEPIAIISPHAGYVFSGKTAASSFNQIDTTQKYDNVFILAPSHHVLERGAALYTKGNYETPLGEVNVNIPLCKELIKKFPTLFCENDSAQEKEHSLEVQLPFLQYKLGNKFQLVPIVVMTDNADECKQMAAALSPYFNARNLFVFSSDLSHYPTFDDANRVDSETIHAILSGNPDSLLLLTSDKNLKSVKNLFTRLCGKSPVLVLMYLTQSSPEYSYHLIEYSNSAQSEYGDKERVVGYGSIAVKHENNEDVLFTEKEKLLMLKIAHDAIINHLQDNPSPTLNIPENSQLNQPMGAFVSLYKKGALRGCIGTFHADEALYKTIQEMAIASAMHDHRFEPVELEEMEEISIEISVLTPLKKINNIHEIVLGKHGIYIKKGGCSGTFLPQVADKTHWTLEEFLGHCAEDKAGIGWNGWKDADIYTYEAIVFGEE